MSRDIQRRRKVAGFLSLALIFWRGGLPAGATLAAEAPDAKAIEKPPAFDERWYIVMMQDPRSGEYQPCGYMQSVLKTIGDRVHSKTKTRVEIRRGAASVEMVQEQNHVESLDGRPLSFQSVQAIGKDPERVDGVIKGDQVVLTVRQYGQEKERATYAFDPEIRFPWGQSLAQRKWGLKPGTEYVLKSYEPAFRRDGAMEMQCKIMERSSQNVLGHDRELTRIRTVLQLGGEVQLPGGGAAMPGNMNIESDVWVDDEFTPVVMTMNMGIMQMKMYETTKEEAMKRGAPPEMFFETFVHTNRPVGSGAKEVVLRLRLKEGAPGPMPALPTTMMQTLQRENERQCLVTLRRDDWDRAKAVAGDEDYPEAVRALLGASSVCDAKDAKIRRLARRATRGLKAPAEKAAALREFVTRYITNKNMDVGFATASDVARNRSGDCTEHAVLLAALCRAAGLPARGVSGIVEVPDGYVPGDGGSAFGYHMWTQVSIGGQWIDIDAAMRQTDCEPNHIALCIMPLGDEGLVNAVASLIPLLGRLEIDVVDVKK